MFAAGFVLNYRFPTKHEANFVRKKDSDFYKSSGSFNESQRSLNEIVS